MNDSKSWPDCLNQKNSVKFYSLGIGSALLSGINDGTSICALGSLLFIWIFFKRLTRSKTEIFGAGIGVILGAVFAKIQLVFTDLFFYFQDPFVWQQIKWLAIGVGVCLIAKGFVFFYQWLTKKVESLNPDTTHKIEIRNSVRILRLFGLLIIFWCLGYMMMIFNFLVPEDHLFWIELYRYMQSGNGFLILKFLGLYITALMLPLMALWFYLLWRYRKPHFLIGNHKSFEKIIGSAIYIATGSGLIYYVGFLLRLTT